MYEANSDILVGRYGTRVQQTVTLCYITVTVNDLCLHPLLLVQSATLTDGGMF